MKVCEITGKVAIVGNNVSHSYHKTKRKFSPNLKTKRFWSEQEALLDYPEGIGCRHETINKKGLQSLCARLPHLSPFTKTRSNKWQRKATEFRSSSNAPNRKRAEFGNVPLHHDKNKNTPTVWSARSTTVSGGHRSP